MINQHSTFRYFVHFMFFWNSLSYLRHCKHCTNISLYFLLKLFSVVMWQNHSSAWNSICQIFFFVLLKWRKQTWVVQMLQWFISNKVATARGKYLHISSQSGKSWRNTECPEKTIVAKMKVLHRNRISLSSAFSAVTAWIWPMSSRTHKTHSVLSLCFSKTVANCSNMNLVVLEKYNFKYLITYVWRKYWNIFSNENIEQRAEKSWKD